MPGFVRLPLRQNPLQMFDLRRTASLRTTP